MTGIDDRYFREPKLAQPQVEPANLDFGPKISKQDNEFNGSRFVNQITDKLMDILSGSEGDYPDDFD